MNHEQFPMQMTQNNKHNKWLEMLAGKNSSRAEKTTTTRSGEAETIASHSDGNVVNTATTNMYKGSDKYYNYTENETDEEHFTLKLSSSMQR